MRILAIIYLLSFALFANVFAQDSASVKYDDRQVEIIPLEKSIIEKYQADEDFNYYQRPKASVSVWEAIKRWLRNLMEAMLGEKMVRDLNDFLIYLVFGAAVLIAVALLLRAQRHNLFYSPSKRLDYEINDENIHEINFEDQIRRALNENDFRKAVRLVYLHAIKLLSDQDLIKWMPGKTNHEYLDELRSLHKKQAFADLGFYFEYVWYGHFEASPSTFEKVKKLFDQVKSEEVREA